MHILCVQMYFVVNPMDLNFLLVMLAVNTFIHSIYHGVVEVQVYKALGIAKDRVQISQELNLVFACYRPFGAKRTKSSCCGSSLQGTNIPY